jgi:hypothetical protein
MQVKPVTNFSRMIQVKKVLYAPGTWALPAGPYKQCWVCGEDTHMAIDCPQKRKDDVPAGFCVACLGPLWNTDGVQCECS